MALKTKISIDTGDFGKLGAAARRAGQSFTRLGSTVTQTFGRNIGSSISGASLHLKSFMAIAAGGSIALGAKRVLDYQKRLSLLKVNASLSEKQVALLDQNLRNVGGEVGVSSQEMMDAMMVFQDFGGQLEFGASMAKELAKFSKATNTPMQDAAMVSASIHQNLKLTKEETLDAMVAMKKFADAGNISMGEIAGSLSKAISDATGKGFTGTRAVQQLGASLQVIGKSTGGSPEEAQTRLRAFMNDILQKQKQIEKTTGFSVVNKDGTLKDLDIITDEMLKRTKGNTGAMFSKLGLSGESVGVLSAFGGASGISDDTRKMFDAGKGARGSQIDEMFSKFTSGIGEASHRYEVATAQLTNALEKYGQGAIGFAMENKGLAAGGAIGGYIAMKALPKIGGALMRKMIGGKAGDAIGQLAGSDGQNVFVTNWPGSFGGGAGVPSVVGTGGGAAARGGMGLLGKAGLIGLAGAAGYGIGTLADQQFGLSDKISTALTDPSSRLRAHAENVGQQSVFNQAERLSQLRASGLSSFEVAPGRRSDLDLENMIAVLQIAAQKQGVSAEAFQRMVPQLERIATGAEKAPQVVVRTESGLDKPSVQFARGPKI